jgi:hypothetical protein
VVGPAGGQLSEDSGLYQLPHLCQPLGFPLLPPLRSSLGYRFFWWYTVVLLAFVLYFMYTNYISRSISVHTKKRGRGRPATGHDPAVTTRLPVEVLVKVEKWAVDNECQRSQAIARLVQLGLAAAEKRGRGGAAK